MNVPDDSINFDEVRDLMKAKQDDVSDAAKDGWQTARDAKEMENDIAPKPSSIAPIQTP